MEGLLGRPSGTAMVQNSTSPTDRRTIWTLESNYGDLDTSLALVMFKGGLYQCVTLTISFPFNVGAVVARPPLF